MAAPETVDHTIAPAGLGRAANRGKLLQVLGVSFGVAVLVGNTILDRHPPHARATWPRGCPARRSSSGSGSSAGSTPCSGPSPWPSPARWSPDPAASTRSCAEGSASIPGSWSAGATGSRPAAPIALGAMVFTEYLEPLVPALAGRRVPAGVGAGAPLRAAALARHPDRRPLAADPERAQGAGVRRPDRRSACSRPCPPATAVAAGGATRRASRW